MAKIHFEISGKTLKRVGIALAILLLFGAYFWVTYRQGDFNQNVQTRIKSVGDSTATAYKTSGEIKTAFNQFCNQYNVSQKTVNDSLASVVNLAKGNGSVLLDKWSWVVKSITTIQATQKKQDERMNAFQDLVQGVIKNYGASLAPGNKTSTVSGNTVKTTAVNTVSPDTAKINVGPVAIYNADNTSNLGPVFNTVKKDSTSVKSGDQKKRKKSNFLKGLFKGGKSSNNISTGPFWGPVSH